MRIVYLQFMSLSLILLWSAYARAQNLSGTLDMGEGGEVVVTGGFVMREVANSDGERPFIAVGTDQGYHFLFDPNMPAVVGFWRGLFGREDPSGKFLYNESALKPFHLGRVGASWAWGEQPRYALSPE